MTVILKAENISKQYRLGTVGMGTIKDDLKRNWYSLLGKEDPFLKVGAVNDRSIKSNEDYIWALQDINFEVQQGEVLGIIGKNGAGKSTLLKILSRVTAPTTGIIKTRGRIASLLEVGTGFHPELTGRENIFLNGAILGMTKVEISRKIDEIIDFSGCERYIDTPTKRYSSGMTVRLAFAVAAHLEPEILVVDEVLAVGDAEFQKKAIGKMQDISKGEGRTVIFVSHNMESVARLCSRTLLMDNGSIIKDDTSEKVIEYYLQKEFKITSVKVWEINQFQNSLISPSKVWAHDENYESLESFDVTQKIGVTLRYRVNDSNNQKIHTAFNIYNASEINIFDAHESNTQLYHDIKEEGFYETTMWIQANLFSEGIIIVGVALITHDPFKIHFHDNNVVAFNMLDNKNDNLTRGDYVGNLPGIIRPLMNWISKKIDD